jgi:hypothetical protein
MRPIQPLNIQLFVLTLSCENTLWGIVHISLRITDTNCTYISQRITGHLEAGESRTAVSDRALYIAVRLYMSSWTTLEIWKDNFLYHGMFAAILTCMSYEFVFNIFRTYPWIKFMWPIQPLNIQLFVVTLSCGFQYLFKFPKSLTIKCRALRRYIVLCFTCHW